MRHEKAAPTTPAALAGERTLLTAEPAPAVPGPAAPAPPRFRLDSRLGAGSMGVVYRAHDPRLDRPVALKFLRPEVGAASGRFVREARLLARLSHPNLVKVHEAGMLGGRAFLAMELIDGPTLREAAPGLGQREKVRITLAVVRALAVVHGAGVVHRDVKPGNVLLRRQGGRWEPVLVDFGIARAVDELPGTAPGLLLGTPAYLAPEQAACEPAGPTADLYSVGAMLYELLTGHPPFGAGPTSRVLRRTLSEAPRPPREQAPEVPADLEAIVLRCLEKDPAERYPRAEALAADLAAHLAGARPGRLAAVKPSPPSEPARARRRPSPGARRRRAWAAAALLALAALASLWWTAATEAQEQGRRVQALEQELQSLRIEAAASGPGN